MSLKINPYKRLPMNQQQIKKPADITTTMTSIAKLSSKPSAVTLSKSSAVPSAPQTTDVTPSCLSCKRSQQILVCYTPVQADNVVTCVTTQFNREKIIYTTDDRIAQIPADAIIDSIEFFGIDGFSSKETFSIGLGQLNADISFPLIVETDSTISNERVGGHRQFLSNSQDGKTDHAIVLYDSNVNVFFRQPVTSGYLQIVIKYHFKIVT